MQEKTLPFICACPFQRPELQSKAPSAQLSLQSKQTLLLS